jgi:prefoldin subunit 5
MTSLSEENATIRSELQLLRKEYAEVKGECTEVKMTMDAVAALSMLGKEVVFEKGKGGEDSGRADGGSVGQNGN